MKLMGCILSMLVYSLGIVGNVQEPLLLVTLSIFLGQQVQWLVVGVFVCEVCFDSAGTLIAGGLLWLFRDLEFFK